MKSLDGGFFYIVQTKNNKGIIYVGAHIDGRLVRKSTKLQATAGNIKRVKKNAYKMLLQLLGKKEDFAAITFRSFSEKIIAAKEGKVSKSTLRDLKQKNRDYILPYFGKKLISEIKPLDIESWQSAIIRKKGKDMARRCKKLLSHILKKAVVNGLIMQNPVPLVEQIKIPKKQREIYTKDEIHNILSYVLQMKEPYWFKIYMLISITTGMRPGEIIALKTEDINFLQDKIYVRRAISKGIIKEPKTGAREIDLLEVAKEPLLKYIQRNKKKQNDFLFTNKYGEHWYSHTFITNKFFKPMLEKLGIRYKSIYALRHAFITLLLDGGMDIKYVQQMAGHATPNTTLKFYAVYQSNSEKKKKANQILTG